ncbi:MAG: DUF3750 domain-containing protein [Patescibacteria group bacterium]
MEAKNFQKLVKPNGYQVFLFICPASIPCNFAIHSWFVCVRNGEISRWEVRFEKNNRNPNIGKHLHVNSLPSFSGIEIIPYISKFLWNAKLLNYIEGNENSAAKNIFNFIEKSKNSYPYRDKYLLWGPNSNTYVQWILNHFPDFNIKLPWNCFGKNYINKNATTYDNATEF